MHGRCRASGIVVAIVALVDSAVTHAQPHPLLKWVKWFFAGTLAVPLFHQSVLYVLHRIAFTTRAPFPMSPTEPLGVPQTFSLAFWGGIWGLLLGLALRRAHGRNYWLIACAFGAILPTIVAIFVVAPLRGQAGAWNGHTLLVAVMLNLAWGFGTAALSKIVDEG
jgi:hypothetical protein